jgi:hypothetical protein
MAFAVDPNPSTIGQADEGMTIDGQAAYRGDTHALHNRLIGLFEESERASSDARAEAERARDYYDGKQWTPEEVAILRKRRQPIVVNNYVKRKIDLLRGIERRGRSDPKAFARVPDEDNRADAATQALRYVGDDQRFDVIRSQVADNLFIEGFGGCEVIVEPDDIDGGYNVIINYVSWDRIFYDAHSRHPAFTDASHMGVCIWQDYDDALSLYPDKADILDATLSWGAETYADKPDHTWCDTKRRRVMTVQHHWKEGKDWYTGTYTRGGFLDDPQKSPYPDRHGNATCPLILRSCYIDREGNRYGLVKDLISPQDAINKRESKILHSLSVNQVVMEAGAVDDVDQLRAEAAKPDGVMIHNRGFEFKLQKDQAEIQGQFALLQHSVQQMNVSGPNAAMAGKDPREQSGRAIIAQQAGGQLEFEAVADAIRQHTRKVYEAVWMRIKQFWTAPKWIRITDDEKNVKFVGLNHPVTLEEELSKMDPDRAQQLAQQMGLQPGDPRLKQVLRIENELSDIDCDIDIEEGPDSPTMAAEQFVQIMQLPPQILQNFPPQFFIKASSLRNKDELIAMLDKHLAQQSQGQQAAQAAQQAMQAAQVSKVQADAADKRAQAVERMHGMAIDHAGQNPLLQPDAPDAGNAGPAIDPLAADAQFHAQQIDRAKLNMAQQQQAHDQALDVAQHGLAVQQAAQPQQARLAP